ncbi:MAG: hypothetical protein AAFX85_10465, partial [Pseudomonadota bacterium]
MTFGTKLILSVAALVVSLQVVNLAVVSNEIDQRATEAAGRDLSQAASVFDQFLSLKTQLASETAVVTAKDFNLKQWLAGDDLETKASVLRTIESRTEADWAAYVTLDELNEITTGGSLRAGEAFPFARLLSDAAFSPSTAATAFGAVDGTLELLVAVAVDAPRTLGYLVAGFTIDGAFLDALNASLPLGLSASFVERAGDELVVVSDLPTAGRADFVGRLRERSADQLAAATELSGEHYLSVIEPLVAADADASVELWFHSSLDR